MQHTDEQCEQLTATKWVNEGVIRVPMGAEILQKTQDMLHMIGFTRTRKQVTDYVNRYTYIVGTSAQFQAIPENSESIPCYNVILRYNAGGLTVEKVVKQESISLPALKAVQPASSDAKPAKENTGTPTAQKDPTGKHQHEPGAKLDAGKNRLALVLGGFPNALKAVGEVGTYGANKYTDNGWKTVPDGTARYTDALYRHLLDLHSGMTHDPESGLSHLAHAAWNALAVLEIELIRTNVRTIDDIVKQADFSEEQIQT